MFQSNRKSGIVLIGIVTVGLLLTLKNYYSSRYSLLHLRSILPLHSRRTDDISTISQENSDFALFHEEIPLVRAYLDIVRDTVSGLTLRTREGTFGSQEKIHPARLEPRIQGTDWPLIGITMIGQKRLINIEWALRYTIAYEIPGDFIECGVWRGGASIFARAVLKALNNQDKHVWLADSFQGLPKPRTNHDNDLWFKQDYLKVPLEEVKTNFRAFLLLDDRVHFCKGYFVESLPICNISKIAVLRMDGDMYESTMDQLFNLYEKIQIGGVIIIDDYVVPECARAINDFRDWHNITEEIRIIPGQSDGRYWIKLQSVKLKLNYYLKLMPSTTNGKE